MTAESLVCSLDLAKRLKELSICQAAYFDWCREANAESFRVYEDHECETWPAAFDECYPAPTAAELAEVLPITILQRYWLEFDKDALQEFEDLRIGYSVRYQKPLGDAYLDCSSVSLADALAKMLVLVAERGYLKKPAEVKA